jgi:uncharacterized RDD family membrane protein YckC
MFTVDEYRARYARSSSQELLDLLVVDQNSLTPAARQALTEETARRGLEPGMTLATVGDIDAGLPKRFIYPKAPLGERFGAYVVDTIIAAGPVIMAAVFNALFDLGTQSPTTRTINYVATLAWAFYYSCTKDARPNGQSIGKKMFGLMVVNVETDKPCTLGQSIGRGLMMSILSGIPIIGWAIEPIAASWALDGRRLGDRAAGTQVIRASDYEAGER